MNRKQVELVCGTVLTFSIGACFYAAWWAGVASVAVVIAQVVWMECQA